MSPQACPRGGTIAWPGLFYRQLSGSPQCASRTANRRSHQGHNSAGAVPNAGIPPAVSSRVESVPHFCGRTMMRSSIAFLVLPLAIGASVPCSAEPLFVQPVDHYVTPIREVQATVIIAPTAPPAARIETIPPPPAATEFGAPAIGRGTTSTGRGCLANTSNARRRRSPGSPGIGSSSRTAGCGLRGAGTKPAPAGAAPIAAPRRSVRVGIAGRLPTLEEHDMHLFRHSPSSFPPPSR